ncbi:hypothetical protein BJ875DRAFT_482752 [Amylocarpus encephaloides]|uniref:Uncharacterized protein n=1 Tax=Amylocarpus encephaloides TaxID=45428 RepID=A0A9P7YLS8_9HELO|nr:hypothetical protein BJ875DRAFT_482752 [Amylocarpus encephaloides]
MDGKNDISKKGRLESLKMQSGISEYKVVTGLESAECRKNSQANKPLENSLPPPLTVFLQPPPIQEDGQEHAHHQTSNHVLPRPKSPQKNDQPRQQEDEETPVPIPIKPETVQTLNTSPSSSVCVIKEETHFQAQESQSPPLRIKPESAKAPTSGPSSPVVIIKEETHFQAQESQSISLQTKPESAKAPTSGPPSLVYAIKEETHFQAQQSQSQPSSSSSSTIPEYARHFPRPACKICKSTAVITLSRCSLTPGPNTARNAGKLQYRCTSFPHPGRFINLFEDWEMVVRQVLGEEKWPETVYVEGKVLTPWAGNKDWYDLNYFEEVLKQNGWKGARLQCEKLKGWMRGGGSGWCDGVGILLL